MWVKLGLNASRLVQNYFNAIKVIKTEMPFAII